MQEVQVREFSEIAGKLGQDFAFEVNVTESQQEAKLSPVEDEVASASQDVEDDDDEDFSFCHAFPDGSPVAAEDVFLDGRIRPVFPLFNRELLLGEEAYSEAFRAPVKKVFVEEGEATEGPYCEWDGKKVVREAASPAGCKKSNSTGFSRLWKFRERTMRSNSDGKDAFVFLSTSAHSNNHNNHNSEEKRSKPGDGDNVKKAKKTKAKDATPFSSHYERNRAKKEEIKRVSYLPYRVGFFANVNGMSRNVHPF